MLDRHPRLGNPPLRLLHQLPRVLYPLLDRHLTEPMLDRAGHVDLLPLAPQIGPPARQPELGRPDIGRQMLLMRYDYRATFRSALEDLDRRYRHAAGAVEEALGNLGIRGLYTTEA